MSKLKLKVVTEYDIVTMTPTVCGRGCEHLNNYAWPYHYCELFKVELEPFKMEGEPDYEDHRRAPVCIEKATEPTSHDKKSES
jgi:hypothetical protein